MENKTKNIVTLKNTKASVPTIMFKNNDNFVSEFSIHVGSLQSKANPEKLRAVLDSDKEIEPPY